MRQQNCVGNEMTETDDVAKFDTLADLAGQGPCGEDLPVVIGIVVGVACDLLSLGGHTAVVITQRVAIGVTMKIDLSFLVT